MADHGSRLFHAALSKALLRRLEIVFYIASKAATTPKSLWHNGQHGCPIVYFTFFTLVGGRIAIKKAHRQKQIFNGRKKILTVKNHTYIFYTQANSNINSSQRARHYGIKLISKILLLHNHLPSCNINDNFLEIHFTSSNFCQRLPGKAYKMERRNGNCSP